MEAKYDLSEVFVAVEAGKVWFSAKSRSVFKVIETYRNSASPMNQVQAETFILDGIKKLTPEHFCESVIQWGDTSCIADVYGLNYDGRPWYVKFMIDEDGDLDEISFHPPEREMVTIGGIKIPKGVDVE